jgi:hypothetical protein
LAQRGDVYLCKACNLGGSGFFPLLAAISFRILRMVVSVLAPIARIPIHPFALQSLFVLAIVWVALQLFLIPALSSSLLTR